MCGKSVGKEKDDRLVTESFHVVEQGGGEED